MPTNCRASHSVAWMIFFSSIISAAIVLVIHLIPVLRNPSPEVEQGMGIFASATIGLAVIYVWTALRLSQWREQRYRRTHRCKPPRKSAVP